MQIKSTLDHVVEAMRPMVGRCWNPHTFGERGEQVIAVLDRILADHEKTSERLGEVC